jgi:hypothetical protein
MGGLHPPFCLSKMPTAESLRSIFHYRDGQLFWRTGGRGRRSGPAGCLGKSGYTTVRLGNARYRAHRLIWKWHYGNEPALIDHIDGDKGNNRIENLRECTPSQNSANTKKRRDNKSGVKSVCWIESRKRWRVCVTANGRRYYGGYFEDIESAQQRARELRLSLHENFARFD